ncbi:YfdX family protein [Thermodesulfatator atlanticus]|uniref:YfdX family protein n=1 Tax=Thermodesulfatator atlanticus TaxID=501497 RepID=UPI0003B5BC65|nr:YfdX family protein [Thermodesulfatator atlanticus]
MYGITRKFVGKVAVLWLLTCLVFVPSLTLAGEKAPTAGEIKRGAVASAKQTAQDIQAKLSQEAIEAVADTHKALTLLDQGKVDEAVKVLQDAIGKLEVVLSANPDLAYVPINVSTVAFDLVAEPDTIKKTLKEVKKLLDEGRVQDARRLLNTLQSEIDIIVEKLPLATYPDSIKLAVKYIANGKIEEAKAILSAALSSIVQDVIVIPLPIVRADILIQAASKIAKTEKEKAIELLNRAEKQLKVAKLLGYGKEYGAEYEDLLKRIEALKKEIKGKNESKKMFEDLLEKIKAFRKHFEPNEKK